MTDVKKKRFLSIQERDTLNNWAKEHREFCKVSTLAEIHKRAVQDTALEMSADQVRGSLEALAIEYAHVARGTRQAALPLQDRDDVKILAVGIYAILCCVDENNHWLETRAALRLFAEIPEAVIGAQA